MGFLCTHTTLFVSDSRTNEAFTNPDTFAGKTFRQRLQLIRQIHFHLVDVTNEIKKMFSLQILCTTVIIVLHITNYGYTIYKKPTFNDRMNNVFWAVFNSYKIYMYVNVCQRLENEVTNDLEIILTTDRPLC